MSEIKEAEKTFDQILDLVHDRDDVDMKDLSIAQAIDIFRQAGKFTVKCKAENSFDLHPKLSGGQEVIAMVEKPNEMNKDNFLVLVSSDLSVQFELSRRVKVIRLEVLTHD